MYTNLKRIGHGGFGEVFQGKVVIGTSKRVPVALKRALPSAKPGTDIEQHLEQQIRRLDALQREAQVYFSPTFNTGDCRHLALLFDVAQVRNSDGDSEPVLVLNWADGPGNTLTGWLQKHRHTDIAATIKDRLGFAVQMFAGLRELHYGIGRTSTTAADRDRVTTTPLFVHQDLKPANILLFGGGEDDGGPVRLALTDFGLTVQYNVDKRKTVCSVGGGTACYMAPEQWLRLPPLSPGRDMWAAGMVLAQLFGGTATVSAVAVYRHYLKSKGQ
jgi:serine/threonine protein kinase